MSCCAAETHGTALKAASSTEHLVDNHYDASCCVRGHLHNGDPNGEVTQLAGIPTYVAVPPASAAQPPIENAAIIILTDVFGFDLPNVRLIADKFAAAGLTCYIPDILNGDPVRPELFDLMQEKPTSIWGKIKKGAKFAAALPGFIPWLMRHGDGVTLPICEKVIRALREEKKIQNLAAIGYCFGGRPACIYGGSAVAAELRLNAFAGAHPSRVAIPADINNITVPSLWIIPEKDHLFSKKDGQVVSGILEKKMQAAATSDGKPNPMEFVYREYAGCTHGFAVRGDENDPIVVKARDDALNEAIVFFRRHLASQPSAQAPTVDGQN